MVLPPNTAAALRIGQTDSAQHNSSPAYAESAAGDNAGMGNQGPGGEGVPAHPHTTTKDLDIGKLLILMFHLALVT